MASFAEIPSNRWAWASYSSESFRAEGSRLISALVSELKRTGLSKRVIGFHICGFRDWQFGTPNEIDFSQAAHEAYRKRGAGMDYAEFVQREPTQVQNEFARHIKAEMGKDVVLAASGVPYDQFLVSDALADPSMLDRYGMVVWFGLWKGGDAERRPLLERLKARGKNLVLHERLMGISGRELFDEARRAGVYAPADRYGLQVDMNGGFISLHCLMPGHYDFTLPFPAKVVNLKTGLPASTTEDGKILPLDVVAGETRWYSLR